MPTNFHLDYETYSDLALADVGAHRYISDPSGCPLMLAIAREDEEPHILLPQDTCRRLGIQQDEEAVGLLRQLAKPDSLCWAHNAPFERAVTRWKPTLFSENGATPPNPEQWRCTMVLAMRAGLPAGLGELAATLKLPQQKDTEGKRLLRMFSKPRAAGKLKGTRIMPWDEPEEFMELVRYCLQDIRTEQAVYRCLKPFELKGALLDAYLFDIRMNDRGVPVNVPALRAAKDIIDGEVQSRGDRFRALTGGLNPTQRERVQNWLKARGYPEKDLTAVSVKRALAEAGKWADAPTLEALTIKQDLSFAATSKVNTMLECEVDGRVYGTMQFYGAGPGRWAGRLIQPHNFKRPTYHFTEGAYAALCSGLLRDADAMSELFGPPLEVLSSAIRHFIQLPGSPMLDADFSNVEARVVNWLAGQEDVLDMFRSGAKIYEAMAAKVFETTPDKITKGSIERFIGKEGELGCGFGMGWKKFSTRCRERAEALMGVVLDLDNKVFRDAVRIYREAHPKVVEMWWACDRAARAAIAHPGQKVKVENNNYLSFSVVRVSDVPFLLMHLPSGRSLAYPWPEITPCRKPVLDSEGNQVTDEERDGDGRVTLVPRMRDSSDITFYGALESGAGWGRVKTYGGKLVENATQGTAFDLMAHGAVKAEKQGMDAFMTVHDEMLCSPNGHTAEELCAALTELPAWAKGLPLTAEGAELPYYKK